MAEHALVPPTVQLHLHRNSIQKRSFFPTYALTRTRREYSSRSCKLIQSQPLNFWKPTSSYTNLKLHHQRDNLAKCKCLGALVNELNSDAAMSAEWVPYADQVLLMASIFLTYIAGVAPAGVPLTDARKSTLSDSTVPKNSSIYGSAEENDNEDNIQFAWDIVKIKLLDSLYAVKQAVKDGYRVSGMDKDVALQRSSLFALAELPRLRCLWASFEWLRKEVDSISGSTSVDMSTVFARIIQNSGKDLCLAWLEEELCLKDNPPKKVSRATSPILVTHVFAEPMCNSDIKKKKKKIAEILYQALLSAGIEKLKGYDNILEYIRKSGKEDLYTELIGTLRFGSAGLSGCYDPNLFTKHGVSILEDLVITLADGIATMYVELISVDSSVTAEMNCLGSNLCSLSTRALQKLRNEVALHQWLHQNMESVVSMYEDCFELRTFQTQLVESNSKAEAEDFGWWKKLGLSRSGPLTPTLSFVVISQKSMSVKRTKELRALTGWKYYFSLFLELSDIAMPMIRTVISKVSDAISFFLVCLIGRSLGLIYTGIRQSLRWK
ncbi:OLC1v1006808C1 [Oldenlandia corymbosa var. corymbosa]|nr:OLC1v1006808C1 [Oldenlandia corymbosa var. corymbosa]